MSETRTSHAAYLGHDEAPLNAPAPQGQDIPALIERLRHPDWNQSEQDEALIALEAQQAEIARLRDGLGAIRDAPSDVPAKILRDIAYDIGLNCIDGETAVFQITRRAALAEPGS